jgi:hypothetical protein
MFKITLKRVPNGIPGLPDSIPRIPVMGIRPHDINYITCSNGKTRAMVTYHETKERKEEGATFEWTGVYWKFIHKFKS